MVKRYVSIWTDVMAFAVTIAVILVMDLLSKMGAEAILNQIVGGVETLGIYLIAYDVIDRIKQYRAGNTKVITYKWGITDGTALLSLVALIFAQGSGTLVALVLWLVLTALAAAGFVVLRIYWYTPSTLSAEEKETEKLEEHTAKYSTMTQAEIKADLKSFLVFAFKKDKVSEGLDFTRQLDSEARTSDELDASTDASVKTIATTVDKLMDSYATQYYATFHTA